MSDGITATWHAEALDRALTEAVLSSEAATVAGFTAMAEVLKEYFGSRTPSRSGNLAGSWGMIGPVVLGGEVVVQLGPTAVYGRRAELGFKGRHDGVRGHNSTPGRHYVDAALSEAAPVVIDGVKVMWDPPRLFGMHYG